MIAAVVTTLPAQAGPQFADLAKWHLPPDVDTTQALAYGDVDGDGDLDLVLGNGDGYGFGRQNRLYLNDGAGIFSDVTTARLPRVSDRTTALALGDVDGDGDLDLVVGNGELTISEQNRLFLNDGTGSFTDVTATRMPASIDSTRSVTLGDVDGDGDLDLVVGNYGQNRLYRNNGAGTFTEATVGSMPLDSDMTRAVALGDVDRDGDLDLVFGNGSDAAGQQNRLYLNNGAGSFIDATASRMPLDSDNSSSLAFVDVDRDGDLDLVIGNGAFLVSQQNRLYLNDGMGIFRDATTGRLPAEAEPTSSVAAGDMDGDGDVDLVVGNGELFTSGQNRLYANDGTGVFTDATSRMPMARDNSLALALGDVDRDGDLDIAIANTSLHGQQKRLYLNSGTGSFVDATARRLPLDGDQSSAVALGDVDGDRDLDLVVGNRSQNRLYRNNASGTFAEITASHLPVDDDLTTSLALGDIDGDGDLDLLVGNAGLPFVGAQNRLYVNNGAGTFTDVTASKLPIVSDNTRSLVLGDVDGDGDLDIVIGNGQPFGGQQNKLYLNDGTGTFLDATASRMPQLIDNTNSVAVGDVDGDGDLDLVVGNTVVHNRLYLNNGRGTFSDATTNRLPNNYGTSVALGDVDGDGDLDIVVGNDLTQNRLYINNGKASFTDATQFRMPIDREQCRSVALGDVDGDGDLDIVIGNHEQQNRLYLNYGNGAFVDATTGLPTNGTAIALGDIDGDFDLDVVIGDIRTNRLFTNLQRQLHAPLVPRVGQPSVLEVYARSIPSSHFEAALPYLSTRRVSIPLPPFGTLGIDPMIQLPLVVIPQPAGVATASWDLPNDRNLAGVDVFAQAFVFNWPLDARLTNVTADRILR